MNFKNIPKKYRPIPFWSWNEKLDTNETRRQVNIMNNAGIGGYFMHARGGLQTEYLSEEWFENIKAATDEGKKFGMRAWAYDENGWPSGFGGGIINGMGVEYQQKYLRYEDELNHPDTHIAKNGQHYFYYDINPFYVDTLSKKVIGEFIKCTYEPYYERFGTQFEGFFTDEPQISRNGIPWSFELDSEYKERYGENINEHLEELFFSVGNYKETRVKFWKMVTEMFSENYFKQIYNWCDERGLKLTGHLLMEESLKSQLLTNGSCMPHYEYFHIPGMDWLCRNIYDCLTVYQLTSVAQQLGKNEIISETFAMCGHNIGLSELKGIFEWQAVRGVNLLCQHLEGYSLRGIRKRDYPPAMYYQQPWWSVYPSWIDAISRECMLIAETKAKPDLLIIHPQTSVWAAFDNSSWDEATKFNENFLNIIKILESKHIAFHLGDEIIMERHAKVENGKIIIGSQSYNKVISNHCDILLPNTQKILDEFVKQGGQIVKVDDLEENNVIDNRTITYCKRENEEFTLHYFVNSSANEVEANITLMGKKLDIYTGELLDFSGVHTFEPWGSLMIIEDGSEHVNSKTKSSKKIFLDGEFIVNKNTLNTLTLDKCNYYFDGKLQEKNGYVLNIAERANSLGKGVKIHQDYKVKIKDIPQILYLVTESPEKFEIYINGVEIEKTVCGYFRDKAFNKINIAKYVKKGENIISFDCNFVQSSDFYENYKKSYVFESEKNKLSYDMEIEAVYLLGDFGVVTDGEWESLSNEAYRYNGEFVLTALPRSINISNIEQQGFPFFCGELELSGKIDVVGKNPIICLDFKGVNACKIEIAGKEHTVITDNKLILKDLKEGTYEIKLVLINNLRNLLGPHHLEEGECFAVSPGKFFKERCVWNHHSISNWSDGYCFVKFGR